MGLFDKEKEVVTATGEVVLVKKESFWERIKPKKMTEQEWASWRRRNISLAGAGKLGWIILRFIIIVGISFMILYPYLVKISVSFMSTNDITDKTVLFIPREGSTYFIQKAAMNMSYWSALFNTILLSLLVAVIQLVLSTMVGYGFARYNFFGKNVLFFAVILTLIVPTQTIQIPLLLNFTQIFRSIGLELESAGYLPVILLSILGLGLKNGLYIYMMRQFFRGMPKELEMSAYIDGAGHFKTFFEIMLPNALNMMITVFLFSFTWQWTDTTYNDTLIPKANILSKTVMTVANSTSGDAIQQQALLDTASLLLILPLLLLFLFCQRFFVQSVERSGLVE